MNNNEIMKIMKYLTLLELENETKIDEQMIQRNFRKLAFMYHPDRADERYKDGKRFIELQQAREYLVSNIIVVNRILSNRSSNSTNSSYSYYDERRYREEARRKDEEERRRREEEACRKDEEERRRREEEARRRAAEERERILKEKKQIENKLRDLVENIDKKSYREKEYNLIISLINDYINRLPDLINYKKEYDNLLYKIKKQKTLKFFNNLKLFRKVSIICTSFIVGIIFIVLITTFLIVPTTKYLINLNKYNDALEYIEQKEYDKAEEIFKNLDSFKDSNLQKELIEVHEYLDNDNYEDAFRILNNKRCTFKVEYNKNGGELCYNFVDVYGVFIAECERPGYKFYKYVVDNYEITTKEQLSLNITLTAIYTYEKYNITYVYDGILENENISQFNVDTNDFYLFDPEKEGYIFNGWYDQNGERIEQIKKGTIGDIILTAKYQPISYVISYNLDGGENNINNNSYYNIETNDFTLEYPVKEGYTFIGWTVNGSNAILKDFTIEKGTIGNIDLIANWKPNQYEIKYKLNGGINNSSNPTGYIKDNGDVVIYEPSKTGYTFIGWTSSNIKEPLKEYIIPNGSVGLITLTANFKANIYNISFDVNGGNELISNNIQVIYDNEYDLPIPSKTAYEFMGWTYNENSFNNEDIYNIPYNITLKANWKPIEYNIYYELNDGKNNMTNPSSYNIEKSISLENPSKTGYTFIGWTTVENKIPELDFKILLGTYGDIYVTANFIANTYKISYNVNTGNEMVNNQQVVTYDSTFVMQEPTKTGYTFIGWYQNGELFNIDKWNLLNDVELIAKWAPNKYTIEIIDETKTKVEVTYDTSYVINNTLKENYIFKGYYSEPYGKGIKYTDGLGNSIKIYNDLANIQLYPYYQYKIDFISNGGTEIESLILDENVNLPSNIIPLKEERTFEKWYIDINLTNEYINVIGNVTLYAKWLEETNTSLFNYEISDTVTITSFNHELEKVVIPTHIGNVQVMHIDYDAFKYATINELSFPEGINVITPLSFTNVKKIIIPKSVVEIGYNAFNGCSSLNSIEFHLNSQLLSIGSYAFEKTNLREIKVPLSVEIIGHGAFRYCPLETLYLPFVGFKKNQIEDNRLGYIFGGDDIYYHNNDYISASLKSVYVHSGIIGEYAFYGCNQIENVYLGKEITSIGDYAFDGCKSLKAIDIPNTVNQIGFASFEGCYGLRLISLPFVGRSETENNYFGYIFGDKYATNQQKDGCLYNIDEVIVKNGTVIEDDAFSQWSGIKKVVLPETIEKIGVGSFSSCSGLVEINMPKNLMTIDSLAFDDCESLKEIKFNNELITIGKNAFSGCSNLTSIMLSDNVTTIGQFAFFGCSKIKELFIPEKVSYIDKRAFGSCSSLEKIVVDSNNKYYDSRNNCNAIIETESNKLIFGCKKTIIPNTVIFIEAYAFSKMGFESKIIPRSITGIGSYAFEDCYYYSDYSGRIFIPNSVINIGDYAFYGCYGIIIRCEALSTPVGWDTNWSCYDIPKAYYPNRLDVIYGYSVD